LVGAKHLVGITDRQLDDLVKERQDEMLLLHMLALNECHHLNNVLNKLASVLLKRHFSCTSLNDLQDLSLEPVFCVHKHRTEHKDPELVFAEVVEVFDDRLRTVHEIAWVTGLEHPLHDTAAVLVYRVVDDARLYLPYEVLHRLQLNVPSKRYYDFLNDVVPIEVEAAVVDLSCKRDFLHQSDLVHKAKLFKAGLHHSAAVLVC
jgi:hypothetical protein